MTFVGVLHGELRAMCSCGQHIGYGGETYTYTVVVPPTAPASGFSHFGCPSCGRIFTLQLMAAPPPRGPNGSMAELQHSFAAW